MFKRKHKASAYVPIDAGNPITNFIYEGKFLSGIASWNLPPPPEVGSIIQLEHHGKFRVKEIVWIDWFRQRSNVILEDIHD